MVQSIVSIILLFIEKYIFLKQGILFKSLKKNYFKNFTAVHNLLKQILFTIYCYLLVNTNILVTYFKIIINKRHVIKLFFIHYILSYNLNQL